VHGSDDITGYLYKLSLVVGPRVMRAAGADSVDDRTASGGAW
jgi:hypothetical protein